MCDFTKKLCRLSFIEVTRPLIDDETTVTNFLLMAGLTMLGGFISYDKSCLIPTTDLDFLGMELNTTLTTIRVPQEKHSKICELVQAFKNNPSVTM